MFWYWGSIQYRGTQGELLLTSFVAGGDPPLTVALVP
jgi:hypothetical protein